MKPIRTVKPDYSIAILGAQEGIHPPYATTYKRAHRVPTYTHDEALRPFFGKAYDILVEHAGARPDPKAGPSQYTTGGTPREDFILAFTQREYPATEYRFQGALGFGGKFWRNEGRYYVTCFREDETVAIREAIKRTNAALAALGDP